MIQQVTNFIFYNDNHNTKPTSLAYHEEEQQKINEKFLNLHRNKLISEIVVHPSIKVE